MNAQIRWTRLFTGCIGLFVLSTMFLLSACGGVVEEGAVVDATPTQTPQSLPVEEVATPVEVTEAFFDWYVETVASIMQGQREGSPVGLYHESSSLTPALLAKLDANSGQGVDPVLHAQDLPQEIRVEAWEMDETSACVVVHQTWSGGSAIDLTVDLIRDGERWLLDDIRPGTPATPAGTTQLFYSWYLSYIGDPATDTFRNPLVDRAYHEAPYVSANFVAEMDALLDQDIAEFGGIMGDPILQAQAIPYGFEVQPGPAEDIVTVNLFFGETVSPVQVRVVQEGEQWLVDGIIPRGSTLPVDGAAQSTVDASGWQTIDNEEFGFSFRLPSDWIADPMDLEGSGIPDDWPVPAGYALMPVEVAEALAAVAGAPPDPNMPMQVLFLLEVVEGDQAAFDRVYVQPVESTTTEINGQTVRVERDHEEYTVVRYVFEHPTREGVWVVLNDALSEFPGREEQAAAVVDILPGILNSISFR